MAKCFQSSAKRTALGTVREAELYGGVLSLTLSREYLALTAEFLRGDEELFIDVLASFIASGRFSRHELQDSVPPAVAAEIHRRVALLVRARARAGALPCLPLESRSLALCGR